MVNTWASALRTSVVVTLVTVSIRKNHFKPGVDRIGVEGSRVSCERLNGLVVALQICSVLNVWGLFLRISRIILGSFPNCWYFSKILYWNISDVFEDSHF